MQKVLEWKEFSGGTILKQMRRLGDSVDWERTYFTMDEKLSRVVRKTFVQLYREGLIYKGTRLVNWDPKLQSAVSTSKWSLKRKTDISGKSATRQPMAERTSSSRRPVLRRCSATRRSP